MRDSLNEYLNSIFETALTVYDVISPTNIQEAQAELLADPSQIKPNFKYERGVLPETLHANLASLERTTKDVTNDATLSPAEKELLELCIDDCWAQNSLVLSIFDYRDKPNTKNARRVRDYNLIYYGRDRKAPIDHGTFLAMIQWYMGRISPHELKRDEDIRMFTKLTDSLRQFEWQSASPDKIYRPTAEIMQRFAEVVEEHFSRFFQHIPQKEEFTAQEVCDIINEIIQTELQGKTKFKAVIDENRTALSVDQIKREIHIPLHRAKGKYDFETVKCVVIGHEFCTHAYRGIPFETSGIIPLYQGMPGYADFDEGLANCVQHALEGEFKDAGFPGYICIGLAEYGNMNFRQIYEIILALDFLSNNIPEESDEEHQKRLEKAQKIAFNRAYRTLRGTNELAFLKDLMYYNSTVMVWKYIAENIDQENLALNLFESGKTDFSKTEHRKIITSGYCPLS